MTRIQLSAAQIASLRGALGIIFQEKGRGHTLDNALRLAEEHGLAADEAQALFQEYGGYCDCEVVFNLP